MNYRNCLKILCSISVVCLCCTCMGCSKTKSTGSTSITLNEVAHSVFYAPQYVAIELGYFKEEGIDLTLVTGFGADNVMTSLISGDAQIGLMGKIDGVIFYLCIRTGCIRLRRQFCPVDTARRQLSGIQNGRR